jgi:probable rRNA maturation factor
MQGEIQLVVEDASWRTHRGLLGKLAEAAEMARKAARLPSANGITILLADDARLKTLNRDFRNKNKPTNVLSFPSGEIDYCGDIALAYGVTYREARMAKKSFADHATHLVVHGVLHLGGYDHERTRDAKVMEPLEIRILARLGVADPYQGADQKPAARVRRKSSVAKRAQETSSDRVRQKRARS